MFLVCFFACLAVLLCSGLVAAWQLSSVVSWCSFLWVFWSLSMGLFYLLGICCIFSMDCFFASLAAWFVLVQLKFSSEFLLCFLLFLVLHTVQPFR